MSGAVGAFDAAESQLAPSQRAKARRTPVACLRNQSALLRWFLSGRRRSLLIVGRLVVSTSHLAISDGRFTLELVFLVIVVFYDDFDALRRSVFEVQSVVGVRIGREPIF